MQIIDMLAFLGDDLYCQQTPEQLLQEMDHCGIERTFVAPSERYVTVYNREGNDWIADVCRRWPDRFSGYAVSNPWYGEKSVTELRRALDNGLEAVYFDSSIQGFTISDEIVHPLIEVCRAYQIPVYFHTGTPAFALPFQLHFLAKQFPDVTFIMGHAGANDFSGDAIPACRGCDNILMDTSLNPTVSQRSHAAAFPDRLVFSSAAPKSKLDYEMRTVTRAISDEALLQNIFAGNILRVLGKE